jgi:hypothetical protein
VIPGVTRQQITHSEEVKYYITCEKLELPGLLVAYIDSNLIYSFLVVAVVGVVVVVYSMWWLSSVVSYKMWQIPTTPQRQIQAFESNLDQATVYS